jgi:hypothetical protein
MINACVVGEVFCGHTEGVFYGRVVQFCRDKVK